MSKSINPMFFLRSGTKQVRLRPGFHRLDEFATGYSLAGCTPAEPASASPIVFHLRAEARYLSTVSWRRIAGLQGSAETEYQHQVGANLDERDGATPDERTQIVHQDLDGRYYYGCLQFRVKTFWYFVDKFGLAPNPEGSDVMELIYDCAFQKRLAVGMILDNPENWKHWRKTVQRIGLPPGATSTSDLERTARSNHSCPADNRTPSDR